MYLREPLAYRTNVEGTAVNVGTYMGGGIFNYTGVQIDIHVGGIGTRFLEQREKINQNREILVVLIVSFERLTLNACVA